jgi:branched-chain amino acid transport system ATP-binding protein
MTAPLLRVQGLEAWYGDSHILHGIDFEVAKGELVTLLGRNGSGRTTTLKSILGLVSRRKGAILFEGKDAVGLAPHRIAYLGVSYCPEERGIFTSLNTEENLLLLPEVGPDGMSVEAIDEMFPNLKERRKSPGGRLSGGEQQMLALARILRVGARLLLLDEITEGLAPVIVQALGRAVRSLKAQGQTIVLVEQNFRFVEPLADRHYVIEHGQVVDRVGKDELPSRRDRLNQLLGV